MTLGEIKKKTLSLIEEIDTTQSDLTNDPDIANKISYVINQIQYELSRIKKIPAYIELSVLENELITFDTLKEETSYEVYQLKNVKGVKNEYKADGTIVKCLEDGTAEIEYYKYPTRINSTTSNSFEFELSDDVLECMPYGVAADILKSDVSNDYGNVYANRYEQMKQQLDTRYNTGTIEIGDGI